MNFFDLHCDTLYKAVTEKSELDNPSYEVKLNNNSKSSNPTGYSAMLYGYPTRLTVMRRKDCSLNRLIT